MKTAIRILLLTLAAIDIYLLFFVILFKFSPVQAATLLDQLWLVIERPSLLEGRLQRANFAPFYTIKSSLTSSMSGIQWLNLYGNVFIFIPTGVLVALIVNKQKITLSALISFLLSLLLESLQLVLSMGSFDVDDLILNTLGGILGGSLVVLLLGIADQRAKRRTAID